MIRDAVDHLCFAGAANAVGTREVYVDAGVEQNIQNGLARRHRDGAPAAMQAHVEAAIRGRIFCHRRRLIFFFASPRHDLERVI